MSEPALTILSHACPALFGGVLAVRTLVEYSIYIGAIILVTVIVTLWLATTRLPLKDAEHSHRRHRSSRRWFGGWFRKKGESGKASGKRRRRRARRRRNPTLAETGGLPPVRGQSPPAGEHYRN